VLQGVQQDLFDVGGELSIPGHRMVSAAQVERLDAQLEQWNAALAPLKEFILPGGSRAAAAAHLARAVCRRAERSVVALGRDGISVACGEGVLRLRSVQPEGGKAMDAWAYAQGRRAAVGERLS